ncbi:MAG: hypothetical protein WDO15_14110 [Bacteroidota bacterium]
MKKLLLVSISLVASLISCQTVGCRGNFFANPIFVNSCDISVYNGIDVGSEWTMSYEEILNDFIIGGRYSLAITDVPSVYAFKVSGMLGEYYVDRAGLQQWSSCR